jgi:DNA-binding MarR family transcriptional regulator
MAIIRSRLQANISHIYLQLQINMCCIAASEMILKKAGTPPAKAAARGPAKAPAANPAPERTKHRLDNAVPYLLARAGEKMGGTFSKELRPYGMTLNEWRVSSALHQRPHQRLSDLANHTSSDISTLSRVVDGLIKRGLAQRDRSSEDARAIAVSLTAEGAVLTEKIIPLAQVYERVALSGITDEEAVLLRRLLRKIYDNIDILDR